MTNDPTNQLPGVLHALQGPLDRYGYIALAVSVLLDDFGVPIPGEAILLASSVYAATNRLNIYLVFVIAFLAATVGDNIGFAIGRFGGRRLAERLGHFVFLTPKRLDSATKWFERHGGRIVVVARFIDGLRQVNGIIAGIAGMRWRLFMAFNALGAILWVGAWTGIGYFSGHHVDSIYRTISHYQVYVAAGVIVCVAGLVARRVRFAHRAARRATGAVKCIDQ